MLLAGMARQCARTAWRDGGEHAAGWAWAELSGGYTPNFPFKHDVVSGWTVGAGIEHMITSSFIYRVEYVYPDFDTARFFHAGPSFVDYTTQELRIGVSAKALRLR